MSTLKVDTISEKTASGGITFSQDITATLSSSSNVKAPLNASGSAPVYACRAWVNFNGTGTVAIRESGNVSSITDNGGSGDYTVNFTTAMPDANYVTCVTTGSGGSRFFSNTYADDKTVSSIRIVNQGDGGGGINPTDANVVIFR
jgi:hypothetical protein